MSLRGIAGAHPKLELSAAPGTSFIYSEASYSIFQMVAEIINGAPLDEFTSNYFFKEIGNNNLVFNYDDIDQKKFALLHNLYGKRYPVYFFVEKAAAGLYCNIQDISALLTRHTNLPKYPPKHYA